MIAKYDKMFAMIICGAILAVCLIFGALGQLESHTIPFVVLIGFVAFCGFVLNSVNLYRLCKGKPEFKLF